MLIKCPECELQVSDKAISCPHCGYPLKNKGDVKPRTKKRLRLPNGFGSITEQNRPNVRKRFYVRVCVGKDENGKPIRKPLKPQCLFATYNEAYTALVEYNKNPYDLDAGMTARELYDKWSKEYFEQHKDTYQRSVKSAWSYCSSIYGMRVQDIRARHIKGCMENGFIRIPNGPHKGEKRFASDNTKSRIKSLWNLMLDYALEYELVDRNYARTFDISSDITAATEKAKRGHLSFTDEEMLTLWRNLDHPYVDLTIIQCYTGWRPQELGLLRLEDVDFEHWTLRGGMKTSSGTNRIVPIHTCIRDLIKFHFEHSKSLGSEWLFTVTDGVTHRKNTRLTYDKYSYRFNKMINALGLNPEHRPHDPRKQFVTMAKGYGVDEYAIKMIVGHTIGDITEEVYTDRKDGWLHDEIEKIKKPEVG